MATEHEFTEAMLDICRQAKRIGYRPGRFQQMILDKGGLRTAQDLLVRSRASAEGFTTLWELGRLDLSMEALVLRERWAALFTDAERAEASRRLREMGFEDDGRTRVAPK